MISFTLSPKTGASMGLFLPLVVYSATRKRYADWQNSPYNREKTRFLSQKRDKLFAFYDFTSKRLSYCVTFGVKSYKGSEELFESDLARKPMLTSENIGNNCTILIASFYDLLRGRADIRNENEGLSDDEVDEILAAEIFSVDVFLESPIGDL